jgi:hypothetical protein
MTTATVEDYWDSVPTVSEVESSAVPETGAGLQVRLRAHRRSLLRTAGVLGGALALNALSWLPPSRTGPARAAVGSEHTDCDGYNYDNIICTGAPYGTGYCGGDGWFLWTSGTCFASAPVPRCHNRNAWRWSHNGRTYRCADGFQQWCGGSGYFICSWPL